MITERYTPEWWGQQIASNGGTLHKADIERLTGGVYNAIWEKPPGYLSWQLKASWYDVALMNAPGLRASLGRTITIGYPEDNEENRQEALDKFGQYAYASTPPNDAPNWVWFVGMGPAVTYTGPIKPDVVPSYATISGAIPAGPTSNTDPTAPTTLPTSPIIPTMVPVASASVATAKPFPVALALGVLVGLWLLARD